MKNIIIVKSPTFYVLKNDPTDVSYESHDSDNWLFIQVSSITSNFNLKDDDILYIYEKNSNEQYLKCAILNTKNI